MCGHIRKLSSLVCLHNLGNKNYSKEIYSSGKKKTKRYLAGYFNFRHRLF